MKPSDQDIETAQDCWQEYIDNAPRADEMPEQQFIRIIAAALAKRTEECAAICDRLAENALHNSTVLFHHGDEEGSDECEALSGALTGAASTIRALNGGSQ